MDVNGDSLLFRYKGDAIIYRDGQLYWAGTNNTYDGKGYRKFGLFRALFGEYKGFLGKALKALTTIQNGGEFGEQLITTLQNDSHYITIGEGSRNRNTGLRVEWNPRIRESGFDINGDRKRPAFIGLAHELGHALDWINDGTADASVWLTTSGGQTIPEAEKFASHIENLVRGENGIPLREFYGIDAGNTPIGRLLVPSTRISLHFRKTILRGRRFVSVPYEYPKPPPPAK